MGKRPYDHIDEAMRLAEAGKPDRAESAFKKGVESYERQEQEGLAFALGRLGDFYIQRGRPQEALAVLRRAAAAYDPPPAVFADLCTLLLDLGGLDEYFRILARWRDAEEERIKRWAGLRDQEDLSRQVEGPARFALGQASGLAREGDLNVVLPLLDHLLVWLREQGMEDAVWQTRGQVGYAYERAGDLETATDYYSKAVDEGSSDRHTFTRLLINLEKRKQFDQALAVCERAMELDPDANWLLDLRKRHARLLGKSKGKKGKTQEPIPEFIARKGKEHIELKLQQKVSPMPQDLALHGHAGLAVVPQGGKSPRLSAWSIKDGEERWATSCDATGLTLGGETLLAWTRHAAVGEGPTTLEFFDIKGDLLANTSIPDALSEVAAHNNGFYVGCRNGVLYSYDGDGRLRWEYRVPGAKEKYDRPYLRPCPYYVATDQDGDLAVYTSFSLVEAVDRSGRRRWHWEASGKSSKERISEGGITLEFSVSFGPTAISSLAVAQDGSGALVSVDGEVYWLDGEKGKARKIRAPKETERSRFGATGSENLFFLNRQGLRVYKGGRQAGGLKNVGYSATITSHPDLPLYSVCSDRDCWLIDGDGKKWAHLEFARAPVGVGFAGHLFVVAAGSLIVIDTQRVLDSVSPSAAEKQIDDVDGKSEDLRAWSLQRPGRSASPESHVSDEGRITERTIPGKKSPLPARGKTRYISRGGDEVTIEQLALEQYQEEGYRGVWSENDYWWQIMMLLYWDTVYARIPESYDPRLGKFPGLMQDIPHDMFSPEFYARRRSMIAARHKSLEARGLLGIRSTSPEQELRKSWKVHKGEPCRIFDKWQKFNVNDLSLATEALSHEQLVVIMDRLLQNFNENRRGLPDLFLVKGGEPLFAEVKAEKEKVDPAQQAWHDYLADEVNTRVEICRVAES